MFELELDVVELPPVLPPEVVPPLVSESPPELPPELEPPFVPEVVLEPDPVFSFTNPVSLVDGPHAAVSATAVGRKTVRRVRIRDLPGREPDRNAAG